MSINSFSQSQSAYLLALLPIVQEISTDPSENVRKQGNVLSRMISELNTSSTDKVLPAISKMNETLNALADSRGIPFSDPLFAPIRPFNPATAEDMSRVMQAVLARPPV